MPSSIETIPPEPRLSVPCRSSSTECARFRPAARLQLVLEGLQDLLGPPSLELGDDQLLHRLTEHPVPAGGDLVGGVRDPLDVGPHGVGDGERPLPGADQDGARRVARSGAR